MADSRKSIRQRLKFIAILVTVCLVYIEWIAYFILPWIVWPDILRFATSGEELKILLIGDPQLLGDYFTGTSLPGIISQWDSDRFIQKTYDLVSAHFEPDVVVLLGDNLDEGEVATDDQYAHYIHRFLTVFTQLDFNKAIIVPGDNDIGGEENDIFPDKLQRFDSYFRKDAFLQIKFADFIKVNYLTRPTEYETIPTLVPGRIRIVLSHIPLTSSPSYFVKMMLPYLQPHIIFSAHEHKSVHIVTNTKTGILLSLTPMFCEQQYLEKVNLSNSYTNEFMIPTSSYRMGTQKIGYSAAIIHPDGTMYYAIFWLPSRLKQLCFYILLGLTSFILLFPLPIWQIIDHWTAKLYSFCFIRRR